MEKAFTIQIIATPNEFSTARIHQGILQFAAEHPSCLVSWHNPAQIVGDRTADARQKIPEADGYIVCRISKSILSRLRRKRRPVIYIDPPCPVSGKNLCSLYIDNDAIAATATRHLLSTGRCRSFAIALPPSTSPNTSDLPPWISRRLATFIRTLRLAGKSCIQLPPGNEDCILPLLERPIGLYAVNDTTLFQLLARIKKLNFHIPNDILLVGSDNNTEFCEHTKPSLSSIDIDFISEGYLAAKSLYAILNGEHIPLEMIAPTHARLVERESTAAPSTPANIVLKALTIIENHFAEKLSVQEIADQLQVSRQTLCTHFRKERKGSVAAILQSRRLEEVKRLLLSTRLTLCEIAASSGFPNMFYMMTLFRNRFGLTCNDYRSRNT